MGSDFGDLSGTIPIGLLSAKAPEMFVECMNRLKFEPRHNICACLTTATKKSRGYEEIVCFLINSRIHTAISTQVRVFEYQVREFWDNVEYKHVNKEIWIESTVGGKTIKITEQVIREVLNFRDSLEFPFKISHAAVSGIIMTMGYEGNFIRRQVTKTMFGKQWRYLVHILIHCMSSRTAAFDQIGEVFSRALVCLATHRRFNFSRMIFEAMINLPNDGIELPFEPMQEVIFSSMNNIRKTSRFSGTVTPLFPNMLGENPYPEFNIDDEVDDLMASDIEDGVFSDSDGDDDDQATDVNVRDNITLEGNVEIIEPVMSYTEEFVAENDEVLNVNTTVIEVSNVQATATTPSKKKKEPEMTTTVPSRLPPSKGFVFTDLELKKQKTTTTTKHDKGKGKAKEIPEKHKSKKSKDYGLVDEEFLNYATRETTDVVSQLKTQISNLQSREAANSREIRELRIESNRQQGIITQQQQQIDKLQRMVQDLIAYVGAPTNEQNVNQEVNVENQESLAATEPIPSPVFYADMYDDNTILDIDMLLNNEGEGMEVTDENDKEAEKEEEDDEELVITGENKDDDKSSDDDSDSGGAGSVGGIEKTAEETEKESESNTEYKKYEYEQKQTYVEEDGSVIGKMDNLVDEDQSFQVPDEVEESFVHHKTTGVDKSTWWKVIEKPTLVERITQKIRNQEQALTGEILSWISKLQTLPYLDIRELSHMKLINPSNNTFARNIEEFLKKLKTKDKFESFKPQVPECKKLKKKDKDGRRIFRYIVKPAGTVSTVYVPARKEVFIKSFKKREYDSRTHEAVILQHGLPEVRVFDDVDLFSFFNKDLKTLYHNLIQCDMSLKIKAETNLYMRVVARCLSRRYEANVIKKRLAKLDSKKVKAEAKAKPDKDNK
ncbi:hypothetical protein L1987_09156 [Smallanthus sonchifolius]|uniref:Uncharacterized protein n=1 Tax=Smallanthus sonchifolius TaxID=185202 RepID=A0ACB9JMM2_9ASTR|nr:hypothetical protein L1987_09156 [Smallanthus sonchifolius]